jgi:hypothetical protein
VGAAGLDQGTRHELAQRVDPERGDEYQQWIDDVAITRHTPEHHGEAEPVRDEERDQCTSCTT